MTGKPSIEGLVQLSLKWGGIRYQRSNQKNERSTRYGYIPKNECVGNIAVTVGYSIHKMPQNPFSTDVYSRFMDGLFSRIFRATVGTGYSLATSCTCRILAVLISK